jgi:RNA polymerase sigma factor (sigma-70 family)
MQVGEVHTTAHLIGQIRAGDARAREQLFARCLVLLRHWARGRLPDYARDLNDTEDLVQVTLTRALNRLADFEPERQGSFLAYLRTILLNVLRDECRRTGRHAPPSTLDDAHPDLAAASPVELAVGQQELEHYEAVLAGMPQHEQQIIVLRIEFGLSYSEIAAETGNTTDGARMAFKRARARLDAMLNRKVASDPIGDRSRNA